MSMCVRVLQSLIDERHWMKNSQTLCTSEIDSSFLFLRSHIRWRNAFTLLRSLPLFDGRCWLSENFGMSSRYFSASKEFRARTVERAESQMSVINTIALMIGILKFHVPARDSDWRCLHYHVHHAEFLFATFSSTLDSTSSSVIIQVQAVVRALLGRT